MKTTAPKTEKNTAVKMPETPKVINPSRNAQEGNRKKTGNENASKADVEKKLAPNEEL